MLSSPLHMI